jgi:valyl-tRNA synthetase
MAFGTGVVKVTPAHDPNDFATGKRHGLDEINILELDGTLNREAGPFAGMERFKARRAVKEKLEALGLARGEKKHTMTLPRCQRCNTIVEPMISTQWFVKMEPLAKPAIEVVEDGRIQILPEEWKKTYFHWMRNIQDWCISRQLWWGHPIPAWYCEKNGHLNVAREAPSKCKECSETQFRQDEDVLDTWFSSALWPFSTLGWPDETPDLARFYPTDDMETGYDILFFWVARMIVMGMHFRGEVPFRRVLLSGLVTDERGEKMAKVKGNVIDPLDVIGGATLDELLEKAKRNRAKAAGLAYLKKTYPEGFPPYGADALRMTLLSYAPQQKRIALSIKRIEGYRNFANKLWNASRFALMSLEGSDARATGEPPHAKELANRWILSRLGRALDDAGRGLEEYRLDDAVSALYHFVWDELCDWYLELTKPLLAREDAAVVAETRATLVHVLETTLRALHPMMPFITEEIWQRLPKHDGAGKSIMLARYPTRERDARDDERAEREVAVVQALVVGTRTIRAEHDLPRAQRIELYWRADSDADHAVIERERLLVETLVGGATHHVTDSAALDAKASARAAVFYQAGLKAVVPDVIDPDKERDRLGRELARVNKDLEVVEKKLANEGFTSRAPADVVEAERKRRDELLAKKAELEAALAKLG